MKKYLAMVLCLAMLVSSLFSPSGLTLAEAETANSTTVKASKTLSTISLDGAITEATWGKPSLSINKDSYNTGLTKYNRDPENISADLYFRWDATYLYIGVKSPDTDVTGHEENYKGDGLQFKLQAGDSITSEASDICLTWGKSGFDATVGGQSFEVRNGNAATLRNSIKFNMVNEDGYLSMMMAIPHADLGYSASEIKSGATYAMTMLRISGRDGEGASDAKAYSGWLEWGTYWPISNTDLHNTNCVCDNVIVLDNEEFASANVTKASKTLSTISLDGAITEATWGKPSLSINKDSYNTGLTKYNRDPENISADLYFRWDATYLYIGVKSPDTDVTGHEENYKGDGLQFKLQAGDSITSEASDICLTWGKSGFDATVGGQSFEVRNGNAATLRNSIKFNMVNEDGYLSMMMAIPHADLGYSASEIKSGATYAMTMLRISGRDGEGASDAKAYSGWLEWGTYWPISNTDLHNTNCVCDNVIVLDNEEFASANVTKASKALSTISLDGAITEAAWGKPSLSINKDSYNTGLTKYNRDPENISADLYFRWDATYLYIGVKSPDTDVTGHEENYKGDGLQFKLQAGDSITSEASDICLTWGKSGFDATVGGQSFEVRNGNAATLRNSIKFNMVNEDGYLSMMMAIPHADLGYSASEIKSGATYAMTMLRISGRDGEGASDAKAYSGWLEWGTYWSISNTDLHNTNCVCDNVIVLFDENANTGDSGETEIQITNVLDVTIAASSAVAKDGINDTMKIVTTSSGTYVAYMTNGPVFTKKGHSGIYEFRMFEVTKNSATDLGLFYTRSGDIDLLVRNGVVYAVGGSSSNVLDTLSANHSDSNEKAVLHVFEYTRSKGMVINQITAQIPFSSPKGYNYLTSGFSADNKKINSFYLSGASLSWFSYDMSTRAWINSENTAALAGKPSKAFVFGNTFVYETNGDVYSLNLTTTQSTRLFSGVTELKDAYMDGAGQMYLLYSADEKAYLYNASGRQEIAAMNASDYGRLTQDTSGALHILTMENGKAAAVTVLSGTDFQAAKKVVLDSKSVSKTAPIINVPRNGSVLSDTVSILYPAAYRTSNHWYYGTVGLN